MGGRRLALVLAMILGGCGTTTRGDDPWKGFQPREPEPSAVQEVLHGWDVHLCALQPGELILAERAFEFRARMEGVAVSDSEIGARAEKKVEAANRRVAERNAKRGKHDTLATYLQAVNASEAAFREVARREARVEAVASRVLQIDQKDRRSPPTSQEVLFAVFVTVERAWKQLGTPR